MSNFYDIEFFWDPVCPFAWITSRWVAKVSAQTGYKVDWRFIALRLLNKHKNYATEFPPDYEHGHTGRRPRSWDRPLGLNEPLANQRFDISKA